MKNFTTCCTTIFALATLIFASAGISVSAQTKYANDVKVGGSCVNAEDGWDIYTAGSYHYGPSFIINYNNSIDAWFAAPGDTYNVITPFYNTSSSSSALHVNSVTTVAQRFNCPKAFYSVDINCPTWSHKGIDSVTISLYKWNSSYAMTVAGTPVSTYRYTAINDNDWLEIRSNNNEYDTDKFFASGTYLWVLSYASANTGVWLYNTKNTAYITQSYENGVSVSGSFKSGLIFVRHTSTDMYYWDQVAYRSSSDGGKTWTSDKMALKPTFGTEDQFSVCDPGVIKWGDYYYIGYTSTQNSGGIFNHVYVARGTSRTGPWEKWNGTGWGGSTVAPVIKFTGKSTSWGAGEPSMVVKDGTLYFYYTWDDGGPTTRLSVAPADSLNWPALLVSKGTVIDKTSFSAADHCDVKYCDSLKTFIAFHTFNRITSNSGIYVWTSHDGVKFTKAGALKGPLSTNLHNCGVSGDRQGHMDLTKQQYIGYAYGSTWAKWNTRLNPLYFYLDSTMTGIKVTTAEEKSQSNSIYTVDGMKLPEGTQIDNLNKGIYIKNKKKILVK